MPTGTELRIRRLEAEIEALMEEVELRGEEVVHLSAEREKLRDTVDILMPVWEAARNLVWRTGDDGNTILVVSESGPAAERLLTALSVAFESRAALVQQQDKT